MPRLTPGTELRTFLIADIRGYTAYTRERGDEAAAALVARFAELVEGVVNDHEGFLLELRGDEALAVFVSARRALRAAVELQARFKQAGLARGVGIGLDAGEAIPVGEGYRGTALNLAARLCAEAGPGETLASEAVIHLAAKMDGIAYVDPRALRLKGYTDSVRVVDVVDAGMTKGRRLAAGSSWGSSRRMPLAIGGGLVALVVLVIGALVGSQLLGAVPPATPTPSSLVATSPPAASSPSNAPSATPDDRLAFDNLPLLAFYDGSTGQLRTTTPFPSVRNIAFYSAGSFWALSNSPRALQEVNPETHGITKILTIPLDELSGFNFDDNSIWVTDLGQPRVIRLNKANSTTDEFFFNNPEDENDQWSAVDIAVGAGSVWLSRPDIPEVTRINAETGDVEARIPVEAFGMNFGDGALWYQRGQELGRIDPATNERTFEVHVGTVSFLGNIYIAGGYAWTAESSAGTVHRVDNLGRSNSFTLAPGVGEMAATSDTMWVTNANTGQLIGLDLVTGQQRQVIDTGHATLAVAAGGDQLMVAVAPTTDEAIGQLEGEVLRIVTPRQPWFDPSPDPALNWTWEVRQALNLTCLNLVNYADKQGPEGFELVAEAADDMPAISPDGLTYTFKIKPGFKFSPPSTEEVTAETFRSSIARTLSRVLDDGRPGPNFYGDIAGVAEYRDGTARTISGLVADGDQLTITLVRPVPDFLHRLALPFACAIPARTDVLRSGINPDPPVSGAGPYYVASKIHRRLVILKKNPNYHGPRPQLWDAITFRMDTAPAVAIDMVEQGLADAMQIPPDDPIGSATGNLAAEWGPQSDHATAGDQRWFAAAKHMTKYYALNPSSPAFADPDVRRAVSLALNRTDLAEIFVHEPSTELLSPAVPGSAWPTEPVPAPDLEAARALMNGRTLTVTIPGDPEGTDCAECRLYEQAITRQLSEIGITVDIKRAEWEFDDIFKPESGIDLIDLEMWTDLPDPVSLLGALRDDQWLDEATIGELERLEGLTGQDRIDGAVAFAKRLVEDDMLLIPISHTTFPFFISERIGCGFVQAAIGAVDLLSLCIEDGTAAPTTSASP